MCQELLGKYGQHGHDRLFTECGENGFGGAIGSLWHMLLQLRSDVSAAGGLQRLRLDAGRSGLLTAGWSRSCPSAGSRAAWIWESSPRIRLEVAVT